MEIKQTAAFLHDYLTYYEQLFHQKLAAHQDQKLANYAQMLLERMTELSKQETTAYFWTTFAEVIKIDSQLHVLAFQLECLESTWFEMDAEEVIAIIEKDAGTFFSENMGYSLNQHPKSSLLFLIAN